jgi:acyl-CoA synthetase (NDP forming)
VRELDHPIAVCNYTDVEDSREIQKEIGLPVFDDINGALRGLASSREWTDWQRNSSKAALSFSKTSRPTASLDISTEAVLTADQALNLCETYGIAVAQWEIAQNPDETMKSAERIGYPVALKILSGEMIHKTDYGGVALGLSHPNEVKAKAQDLLNQIAESTEIQSFALMVQQMVSDGIEVILGGKRDPHFGPVVMFGLGGIHVEIYNDVAFRVAPLEASDARTMIEEVRGARLLDGFRGKAPVDREALIQSLLSLSQLMVENPNIAEIDINPLIITSDEAVAVDARGVIRESVK